jgi:putative addiction module component (TIGR02574 family)
MGVSQIREELHQFINEADEEMVNRIYEFVKSNPEHFPLLTREQRLDLDKRIQRHKNEETPSFTWPEVREQIENRKK